MSRLAIIVIGYNRPLGILRLLNSLTKGEYLGDKVTLIISIDNSGNKDTENVAKDFKWSYGEKIIKTYKERLGLRNHILKCGDLTNEYENIIVLEDDLYVSPTFYIFAKKAIEFYFSNSNIAGISLYNHLWNVNCGRPFQITDDKYDTYFLKYAQSWGQIWNKKSWNEFKQWYEINKEKSLDSDNIPKFVSGWPKSSWLKYHIKFLVENNKYFVYPKISLTTNFTDVGEHASIASNDYQVSLQTDIKKEYLFSDFEQAVKYDVFFEREQLGKILGIDEDKLCVDLYGEKKNNENKKYWLTLEKSDFKIIQSYGLKLRPHENNIIFNIEGNDIFLYDTKCKNEFNNKVDNIELKKTMYDVRAINREKMFELVVYYCIDKIKNKFKKLLKL